MKLVCCSIKRPCHNSPTRRPVNFGIPNKNWNLIIWKGGSLLTLLIGNGLRYQPHTNKSDGVPNDLDKEIKETFYIRNAMT